METIFVKEAEQARKWYIIDAAGKPMGRVAAKAALIARGKNKVTYAKNQLMGDFVIIINAEKIHLTGNKLEGKIYYRHTQYTGGLRQRTAGEMKEKYPTQMLELAIKGMLPKNSLGRKMFGKLNVYTGSEHPHAAQKPESYTLRG